MSLSDMVLKYEGENPFSDSQPRNFSDEKVCEEFYPISKFWTLFNDQHEVLIGTRGSGKTFLLKMMRYSMLKRIADPAAKKLVDEKHFIALYVPMHLEFVASFSRPEISAKNHVAIFQIAFNCLLAQSLISELKAIIEDIPDPLKRAKTMIEISDAIGKVWFGELDQEFDLDKLSSRVRFLFYNIDFEHFSNVNIPVPFKRQICTSLFSVKTEIARILEWQEEPTWIICVDEAEFLDEPLQKCINSVFRSDSNRIALKVAMHPYHHTTLQTFDPGVVVSNGNDFTYRIVDMLYSELDFVNLTNKLCFHRLKTRFDPQLTECTLQDFLGKIGNDDLIDYYRLETGDEDATYEKIEKSIICSFSDKRKQGAQDYSNKRKTIYDKYSPVFFAREMYKLSKSGNRKPGWYAGANIVRKVAQGNPRAFIQIMNDLFEVARKRKLEPKAQHEVLLKYCENVCKSTQALGTDGPIAYKQLKRISEFMHNKVHQPTLISAGTAFTLSFKTEEEFLEAKTWIELAIVNSRLIVAEDDKIGGIKRESKFILSNAYAAAYWIPMRGDISVKIPLPRKVIDNSYQVEIKQTTKNSAEFAQITLFGENKSNDDSESNLS